MAKVVFSKDVTIWGQVAGFVACRDFFAVWEVLNRRRNGEIEQGRTPSLSSSDAVDSK
jgi:hypothetical protein